jgi:hypothetical protein
MGYLGIKEQIGNVGSAMITEDETPGKSSSDSLPNSTFT